MKNKIVTALFVTLLVVSFVFAKNSNIVLKEYDLFISNQGNFKIVVYDNLEQNFNISKEIVIYNDKSKKIGLMKTLEIPENNVGEGYQFIKIIDNGFIVQQSFGDGRYIICSSLYFEYHNKNFKLVKYTENHIDRFEDEKDFSEIEYIIDDNVYFSNIDSDFVYNIHQKDMRKVNNIKVECLDVDFKQSIKDKIMHLNVYRNENFIQTIDYTYENIFMLTKDFELVDINFDGYLDIMIHAGYTANRGQSIYDVYLWNQKFNEFEYFPEIKEKIVNMKIDNKNKYIYSAYMLNDNRTEYYVYAFDNGHLKEIDSLLQQEKNGIKQYCKLKDLNKSINYEKLNNQWKEIIKLYY